MGRFEGLGIASSIACSSKFLRHCDIVTPVTGNKSPEVAASKRLEAGDEGIILKGPKSSTRLSP
jgi:hypothetical protein